MIPGLVIFFALLPHLIYIESIWSREDFFLLSALNPQRLMSFLEGLYTELSFLSIMFLDFI
jgi:hypothetical protein